MADKVKILLVENESAFVNDVRQALAAFGYAAPAVVTDWGQLSEAALTFNPDLILAGLPLTGWNECLEAVEELSANYTPTINKLILLVLKQT